MADLTWVGGTDGNFGTSTNWETPSGGAGTTPAIGDDLKIQGNVNIDAGLSSVSALLGSITVLQSYEGTIGTHSNGVDTPLDINASVIEIGNFDGLGNPPNGSGRIAIANLAATQVTRIYNSKSAATETTLSPIRLYCEGATSCDIHIFKGIVTLKDNSGAAADVAANIDNVYVSFVDNQGSDVQLTIEDLSSLGSIYQTGGQTHSRADTATLIDLSGGTMEITSDATTASLDVSDDAVCTYNSTGTITALHIGSAEIDFTKDSQAKTVTACTAASGAIIKADTNVTFTAGIDLDDNVRMQNITLEGFSGQTIDFS